LSAPRVLLVEDDAGTRDLLAAGLKGEGYLVLKAARGEPVLDILREQPCSVVILDVGLPDGSGIDWCRKWRRRGIRTPILIVTARGDVESRVSGLDAGADDYLAKPFALSELKARLRALLRRAGSGIPGRIFTRGDLSVDFARRRALRAGTEVAVTRREFGVLERLVEARGRVVAKEHLLDELWGDSTPQSAASLEVIVGRLRRKLQTGGSLIRTVRGHGYAIDSEEGT
jgi:DNA-binding response OmpR family regulator